MLAEALQPDIYRGGGGVETPAFALPGKRYLRCASYQNRATLLYAGVMIAITKQNGDTVRYVQVATHPPRQAAIHVLGAVLEPNYSITVAAAYYPAQRPVPNLDSVLLLRIDTLGNVRWRRGYLLVSGGLIEFGHLLRTGDGYLVCTNRNAFPGSTGPSFRTPHITKFDFSGNIVWERSMGSRGYGRVGAVQDIIACPDGSYLALGYTDDGTPYTPGTSARGRTDYYGVRFSSAGDTLRTYRFGTPGEDEAGERLRLMPDGGVAVIGYRYNYANSPPPVLDGQVYLLDSLWRPRWHVTTAFPRGPYKVDWRYTVLQPLASGNLLCGGSFFALRASFPTPGLGTSPLSSAALTAYTPAGATAWAWQHAYPGWDTRLAALVPRPDGSAWVAGSAATGPLNRSGGNTRFASYTAYLGNVGLPYEADLCIRPPVAYFAALAATPAQVQVLESSTPGPRYGVLVAWRWAWGDGTFSTGQNPGPHTYAAPPRPGTAVTLTVTNNLGCTSTSTAYPFGPLSAAQASQGLSAALGVFPNPTAGAVRVELGGLGPQGPARLCLFNALGQVLRQQPVPVAGGRATATLDVGALPTGVYLLRLTTQEGTATRRLVRE